MENTYIYTSLDERISNLQIGRLSTNGSVREITLSSEIWHRDHWLQKTFSLYIDAGLPTDTGSLGQYWQANRGEFRPYNSTFANPVTQLFLDVCEYNRSHHDPQYKRRWGWRDGVQNCASQTMGGYICKPTGRTKIDDEYIKNTVLTEVEKFSDRVMWLDVVHV